MTGKRKLIISCCIAAVFIFIIQAASAQPGNPYHRPSPSDCDAYASNLARNYSPGFIGGAVRGSARGAVFGGIVGGRKGARKGAALGGVVRGTRSAVNRDQIRRQAYEDCMSGRVRW